MYKRRYTKARQFKASDYEDFNFYSMKDSEILTGIPKHQLRRATDPENKPEFQMMDTRGLYGFPKSSRYFMENDLVRYVRELLNFNKEYKILDIWEKKNFLFEEINPAWIGELKLRKQRRERIIEKDQGKKGKTVYLRYSALDELKELQELLGAGNPSDAISLMLKTIKSRDLAKELEEELDKLKQRLDRPS